MKLSYRLLNCLVVTLLFFTPFFTLGNTVEAASDKATFQQNSEEQNTAPIELEKTIDLNPEKITSAIENASNFILTNGVDSEWEAIGLAKAGKEIPNTYIDVLNQNIADQITKGLENGRIKITDIERIAIAAVAVGLDPTNIEGKNLIELIYNSPERRGGFDTMTFQGNNGPIFALVALDSQLFPVPDDAKWTRQKLIDELLRTQNDDGSWALNESFAIPSIDITGMAIIGLSHYKDQPAVKEALDRAVEWLSSVQTENGGFDGGDFVGGITSEATSQVIIGLTAYGIDPASEQFTKNGNNLMTHLLEFQNPDGGFKHTMDYDYSDSMGTEQALQALVSYNLFLNGKGNLYHFGQTDDELPSDNEEKPEQETPGDNGDDNGEDVTPGDNDEKPGEDVAPGDNDENQGQDITPGNDDGNQGEEVTPKDNEDEQDEDVTSGDTSKNQGKEVTPGNNEQKPNKIDSLKNHSKEQVKTEKTPKDSGKQLPNTATNIYNFILIGIILLVIGGLLFYLHIRKQSKLVS